MKITFYIFILVMGLVFITSCNEDSSTSTALPPGSVIYSQDSLSVILFAPNSYGSQEVSFGQTVSANKVKVEYLLQSNADSVNSTARFQDSTNGTPSRPPEQILYLTIDSAFSYTIDLPAQPFYINFRVKLNTYQSGNSTFFIRFKNIKVTKVQ